MSLVKYRGNLSSAYFPFLSENEGRTVIVPKQDNNFNRQLQSSADTDKDIGIPQIYYGHNIMPTDAGFQSIGYTEQIAAAGSNGLVTPTDSFDSEFFLYQDDIGAKLYVMRAYSSFYICFDKSSGYVGKATGYYAGATFTPFPSDLQSRTVTTAHVSGISYMYIANIGCITWDATTSIFRLVPLAGLDASTIVGIVSSSGYLLAYSNTAVAWSSLLDPTDFVPSLITGAGGGNVDEIKGAIIFASQTAQGLLFYTTKNVVNALYTNNTRYPFAFNEVQGAGGVSSAEQVTYEAATGFNYAYTTKGLQSVQDKTASTVFPDVTDFISGQYFEDYDEATNDLTLQAFPGAFRRKLAFVSSRYFVLSYGIDNLTHAIVFDVTRKRWGKLKIPHVDCFEYQELTTAVDNIPRRSIAFMQASGRIVTVDFSLASPSRAGVVFLGKYQFVRDRNIALQGVQIENINSDAVFSCQDWVSWYGKSYDQKIPGTLMWTDGLSRHYGFGSPDGVNHTLVSIGAFSIVTVQLAFNMGARMSGGMGY